MLVLVSCKSPAQWRRVQYACTVLVVLHTYGMERYCIMIRRLGSISLKGLISLKHPSIAPQSHTVHRPESAHPGSIMRPRAHGRASGEWRVESGEWIGEPARSIISEPHHMYVSRCDRPTPAPTRTDCGVAPISSPPASYLALPTPTHDGVQRHDARRARPGPRRQHGSLLLHRKWQRHRRQRSAPQPQPQPWPRSKPQPQPWPQAALEQHYESRSGRDGPQPTRRRP